MLLPRFIPAIAVLYLSSGAVCAEIPVDTLRSLNPSQSHQLNLSCSECAFSYDDCSQNIHPNAFLTITFSTNHDTLLANSDTIFPTPIPMEFHATRYWDPESPSRENVRLAYTLDILPIPHPPSSVQGDLYHLKLRLVDLQGRRATESPVSVMLVRRDDGSLQITDVKEDFRQYRYHDAYGSWFKSGGSGWWSPKIWKSYLITYLHRKSATTKSEPCVSDSRIDVDVSDSNAATDVRTRSHPSCETGSRDTLASWTGRDKSFFRLVRPVILPGILGMLAGMLACVMGFVLGKIIVSVYYCWYDRRVGSCSAPPQPDLEERGLSEKERLREMYSELDSSSLSSQ